MCFAISAKFSANWPSAVLVLIIIVSSAFTPDMAYSAYQILNPVLFPKNVTVKNNSQNIRITVLLIILID